MSKPIERELMLEPYKYSYRLSKRIVITICALFITINVFAQPFITTWHTLRHQKTITIPTYDGEAYNYDVDWNNDGVYDDIGVTGDASHYFEYSGKYTIRIRGTFSGLYLEKHGYIPYVQIISIDQWGDNEWANAKGAFYKAQLLENNAIDVPNMSKVKDMSNMFYRAFKFNADLSGWDVSNVENMSNMFHEAGSFTGIGIDAWDVSKVEDMSYMFRIAKSFKGPISSWDVSNVTDMKEMFVLTNEFEVDIGNWDVSNVTDMFAMLFMDRREPDLFMGDLSEWDVSKVTNFGNMFLGRTQFNSDLSNWNVSSAKNMSGMFVTCWKFNKDISAWDVSNVTNMTAMFVVAKSFNQNLNNWDVSNVTDMSGMFFEARGFTSTISDWDVSNVTDMERMFYNVPFFNSDITGWDVSSVTDMSEMFRDARAFNQDISGWNVDSVTDMSFMFNRAGSFNQDLSNWNVSNVTDMSRMLGGSAISLENYDKLLNDWSVQELQDSVIFNVGRVHYCAESARQILTDTYHWKVGDSGLDENCLPPEPSFSATKFKLGSHSEFMVYPNPNNGEFNIEYHANKSEYFDITILNSVGEIIHQQRIVTGYGSNYPISLINTSPGIYFVRIESMGAPSVQKFIVQN